MVHELTGSKFGEYDLEGFSREEVNDLLNFICSTQLEGERGSPLMPIKVNYCVRRLTFWLNPDTVLDCMGRLTYMAESSCILN